ncbi:hypothetical protein ALT785_580014 [Alteromonas infernus]
MSGFYYSKRARELELKPKMRGASTEAYQSSRAFVKKRD